MATFKLSGIPSAIESLRSTIQSADTDNDNVLTAKEVRAQKNPVIAAAYKDAQENSFDGNVTPQQVSNALDAAVIRMSILDANSNDTLEGTELSKARRLRTAKALIDYIDPSAPPQAKALAKAIRPYLGDFDLRMFGRGTLHTTVTAKNVNVQSLDRASALATIGIQNPASVKASGFRPLLKTDTQNWDAFVGNFRDGKGRAAATKIRELLTQDNVESVGSIIVDTTPRTPFSASIYLLARMKDGSVVYLKDSIDAGQL